MSETIVEKRANAVVTSSIACLMATVLAVPVRTSTMNQDTFTNRPDAMIRYISDTLGNPTSSSGMMSYEQIERPIQSAKFAAYEMFGEMRSSTDEERALFKAMLARMSKPIDVDIFNL